MLQTFKNRLIAAVTGCSWRSLFRELPRSAVGRFYTGANVSILMSQDRSSAVWGSLRQWGSVRPGAVPAVIFHGFMRNHVVYNEEDTDLKSVFIDPELFFRGVVRGGGIDVRDGEPGYDFGKNVMFLKKEFDYTAKAAYYTDVFHELGHWTGSRLNRVFGKKGTLEYAREELVAEIYACQVCAVTGVSVTPAKTSIEYVKSWLDLFGSGEATEIFMDALRDSSTAFQHSLNFLGKDLSWSPRPKSRV